MRTAPAALRSVFEVPVLPDAGEGRDWALQELSRSVYQEAKPSLLDRFWNRVGEFFADLLDGVTGLNSNLGILLLALGAAALLAVAVLVIRPRLNPRRRGEVFAGVEVREAVDHRRLAGEAAGRGDWNTALVERLRAIIRSAEERTVLDRQSGRTAAEAGAGLAAAFPMAAGSIRWLTGRFDEIQYGAQQADAADAARAGEIDALLDHTVPAAPGTVPAGLAVPR